MKRTIPSERLAWLAGIIEGEGSIALYPLRKGIGRWVIGVVIVNTDPAILDAIGEIYTSLDIVYARYQKAASKVQHPSSFNFSKPSYEITFRNLDGIKKLLPLVIPFMVGEKAERAKLLLAHASGRTAKPRRRVTTKR